MAEKKEIDCPYGFEQTEDAKLPCEITDDYDCRVCANVSLIDTIAGIAENGIPLVIVTPAEAEEILPEGGKPDKIHRRARKASPQQSQEVA